MPRNTARPLNEEQVQAIAEEIAPQAPRRVLLKDGRKMLVVSDSTICGRWLVTADTDRPAPVESIPSDYFNEII